MAFPDDILVEGIAMSQLKSTVITEFSIYERAKNKYEAMKAVFWAILNSNSFKIAQKTAFEAKGRLYTTVKVIQRLFITDLFTYLAIAMYWYRWGKTVNPVHLL